MMAQRAWPLRSDPAGVGTAMITSRAMPVPLPDRTGVSQYPRSQPVKTLPTPCLLREPSGGVTLCHAMKPARCSIPREVTPRGVTPSRTKELAAGDACPGPSASCPGRNSPRWRPPAKTHGCWIARPGVTGTTTSVVHVRRRSPGDGSDALGNGSVFAGAGKPDCAVRPGGPDRYQLSCHSPGRTAPAWSGSARRGGWRDAHQGSGRCSCRRR